MGKTIRLKWFNCNDLLLEQGIVLVLSSLFIFHFHDFIMYCLHICKNKFVCAIWVQLLSICLVHNLLSFFCTSIYLNVIELINSSFSHFQPQNSNF